MSASPAADRCPIVLETIHTGQAGGLAGARGIRKLGILTRAVSERVIANLDTLTAVVRLCNEALDERRCGASDKLFRVIDVLLERPSTKLVTYGTLSPGSCNHHLLEPAAGTWSTCRIHGRIALENELPYLTWVPDGNEIEAHILVSDALPTLWATLDEFEGARYARKLVPVATAGQFAVANIYLAAASTSGEAG